MDLPSGQGVCVAGQSPADGRLALFAQVQHSNLGERQPLGELVWECFGLARTKDDLMQGGVSHPVTTGRRPHLQCDPGWRAAAQWLTWVSSKLLMTVSWSRSLESR